MTQHILKSHALAQALFQNPAQLPIAFEYAGAAFHGIPPEWNPRVWQTIAESRTLMMEISGRDPRTGLAISIEVTRYRDHPVVEWVAWFENTSQQNLPVLQNVLAADMLFPFEAPQNTTLWHGIAECHNEKNYSYQTDPLPPGTEMSFAPQDGRPCDGAFPYFRLSDGRVGHTIAVGWPGQWKASFMTEAKGVRLTAGQQTLAVSLRPGERVRTPRMTVVSYNADADAVNVWRRWYRDHILPRDTDGAALRPRLGGYAKRSEDLEHCKEGEASQLAHLKDAVERGFKFDTWWIDAGWYPCTQGDKLCWTLTGDWRPDPARFPNGMKPLSDALARQGTGLLLWFEPERIYRFGGHPTQFDDKPDSWRIPPKGEHMLLNLANPDTVDYLAKYVSAFIKEHGISVYRQDFNMSPMWCWQHEDAAQGEHRSGITENQHVQGYLRYWDHLLADNPGLWIDSCSSGGRRNDLETMRRAVPLHYSDYGYGLLVDKQRYMHMLYEWFMYFKEYDSSFLIDKDKPSEADLFSISALSPFFAVAIVRIPGYDFTNDKKLHELWRAMKPYFVEGDYHLLSADAFTAATWTVRQFHSVAGNSGVLQCTRNEQSADPVFIAKPKGIQPGLSYTVTDLKTKTKQTFSGAEILRDGLRVELPPRSATVLHYEVTKASCF